MTSRRISSGIGWDGLKRIVPFDRLNPASRSRTASMAFGLNG